MSDELTPPSQYYDYDPIAIDQVIATIQYALVALPWVTRPGGRIHTQINDGKVEPWIYKDDGEYYKAYPNDDLNDAFVCVYPHDDEGYEDDNIYMTRTLSIIAWLNLKRMGIYTPTAERQKRDIWGILKDLDCVKPGMKTFDQTTSGSTSIYPGFDLEGLKERYNTYPFAAFRIEFVVKFPDLCC